MATISGGVCNTYIHMDLTVTETATSVANNTSTLSWKLVGYMGSGGTSAYWYSNNYHTIYVKINGATVYSLGNTTQKSISIGTNATQSNPVTIASGTATVTHDNDGSKLCACSFSCVYRYNSAFTWGGSANIKLTSIARATQPTVSASSVSMGASVTISMPRATSSFTHTLTYKFGSASGTIGSGLGTSKSWTVPMSLASQIPNTTSGACTITCKTYNGSSLVGTKTVSFTANVPASVVPTISGFTAEDPTGKKDKYGVYVQGYSKCKITVSASGAYGSTIKSYRIWDYVGTANNYTTPVLDTSGAFLFQIKVTDSRGRSATYTTNNSITVTSYTLPKATIKAVRCASDGTADETGAYMKLNVAGSITALNNKNSKSFQIQYKKHSASSWTTYVTYTSAYTYNASPVIAADTDYSYDVRVIAKDDFGNTTATGDISTGYTLVDYWNTGKGIAFGKVSEQDGLDVNMDAVFRSTLAVEGIVTLFERLNSSANICLDNGRIYYIRDADGDPRTAIMLDANNKYSIASGGMSNTIQLGSSKTTATNIYGVTTFNTTVYCRAFPVTRQPFFHNRLFFPADFHLPWYFFSVLQLNRWLFPTQTFYLSEAH